MNLIVNNKVRHINSAPITRLSDVLRDELGLIGTKVGCNAGDCGACTVQINGEEACACLVPVGQVEDCSITTIEGLSTSPQLSALQNSFLKHGAAQCGICSPGMLITADALLKRNPTPTRLDIENAMGGVLCRCTGYAKIVDAVVDHSREMPNRQPASRRAVGTSIARLDGLPKVNGTEIFGADIVPADALHLVVIRSPHDRALFQLGDLQSYLTRNPGLVRIFTAKDIPGTNLFGVIPGFIDQPVFAEDQTRFRGEAIAAVVGEARAIRDFSSDHFPVAWTALPALRTPQEALADTTVTINQQRTNNILVQGRVAKGDVAEGYANAHYIVDHHITTPFVEHAYIEPEAGYAECQDNRLTIFGCTQAPHMDRDSIAHIMALPESDVRILPSACGGGFGSKLDLSFQPYVALATWLLKKPVAIAYTRQESMQSTTKRHPSDIHVRIGCDASGKITATEFKGTFNTGAYASWGPTVANRVPVHASGPYLTPNYLAQSKAVLTNCVPAGAFRGFGVPQALLALECAMDLLAEKANINHLEFRKKNALRNNDATVTGQRFKSGVGILECLEALEPAWSRARTDASEFNIGHVNGPLRRGVGLATCWYGCGNTSLPNPSTIRMGITRQGKVVLHQGATDIGQGSNTVIAQIAADALGIPVHSLILVGPDTDLTPDAGKTSASRQTFVSGAAARKSATALRSTLLRHANLGDNVELTFGDGEIILSLNDDEQRIALQLLPVNKHGYVFMSEESYDPPTRPLDKDGQGEPYAVYGYGAQLVELTVDLRLGTVKLIKITAAHDVGRAINPQLVEGQIEGGIAQGIGLALMENYIPGRTENLHDYLIPTFGDMPKIENIIVEVPDEHGPFGAKGLGEHVLIPTAPAILNAIRNATGAQIHDLPATPDKVLAAIKRVTTT